MKWADDVIIGIYLEEEEGMEKYIESVQLCMDRGDRLSNGHKISASFLINRIKLGFTCVTAKWDYDSGKWIKGSPVKYFVEDEEEYLCTYDSDNIVTNELEKIINLNSKAFPF